MIVNETIEKFHSTRDDLFKKSIEGEELDTHLSDAFRYWKTPLKITFSEK